MSKKRILITMTLVCIFFLSAVIVLVKASSAYVNTYALNVRGGDLWKDKIIKVIRKGDQVNVLNDTAYGWKKIQLSDGTIGFVNGKYLTDSTPYVAIPETVSRNTVKITTFRAFIRDDNQDRIVAVAKDWETLQVVSNVVVNKNWIKVRIAEPSSTYYGREGYIYKGIIEPLEYGYTPTTDIYKERPSAPEVDENVGLADTGEDTSADDTGDTTGDEAGDLDDLDGFLGDIFGEDLSGDSDTTTTDVVATTDDGDAEDTGDLGEDHGVSDEEDVNLDDLDIDFDSLLEGLNL